MLIVIVDRCWKLGNARKWRTFCTADMRVRMRKFVRIVDRWVNYWSTGFVLQGTTQFWWDHDGNNQTKLNRLLVVVYYWVIVIDRSMGFRVLKSAATTSYWSPHIWHNICKIHSKCMWAMWSRYAVKIVLNLPSQILPLLFSVRLWLHSTTVTRRVCISIYALNSRQKNRIF